MINKFAIPQLFSFSVCLSSSLSLPPPFLSSLLPSLLFLCRVLSGYPFYLAITLAADWDIGHISFLKGRPDFPHRCLFRIVALLFSISLYSTPELSEWDNFMHFNKRKQMNTLCQSYYQSFQSEVPSMKQQRFFFELHCFTGMVRLSWP